MDKKNKKKIQKYTTLYMSIGMCFGVSFGLIYGQMMFPDNMALGMGFGLPIGMVIGMAMGASKDKKLSENMMELARMENMEGTSDVRIFALDKNGEEKEFTVSAKKMKEEKFAVGDRVAEEKEGVLVSLESK